MVPRKFLITADVAKEKILKEGGISNVKVIGHVNLECYALSKGLRLENVHFKGSLILAGVSVTGGPLIVQDSHVDGCLDVESFFHQGSLVNDKLIGLFLSVGSTLK